MVRPAGRSWRMGHTRGSCTSPEPGCPPSWPPCSSPTVTEIAPEDQLGSAQAAQAFTASLASSVAPVAAGLMLDLGGGYGGAFVVAGLVGLAGAYNLLPL